jgi:hypothetical protein
MQHRPPLTGLDKLTLTGFVGLTATCWKILFLGGLVTPAVASGVLFLATTVGMLAVPSQVGDFTSTVLLLAAGAIAAIGAIATTVQCSRTPRTTATPR